MDIIVLEKTIIKNAITINDINELCEGDRLFYEKGHKINLELGLGDNWRKSGEFLEIKNVTEYVKKDRYLADSKYLKHHNFVRVPKEN